MPTLEFETTVAAPIDRVWAWHLDARHLERLSPPEMNVRVATADNPMREGSQVTIDLKGPFGRAVRWVARIVELREPHDVVFGREARFVDQQVEGPFSLWRHEHDFERVEEKTTRIYDRITYAPPLGPVGLLIDVLYLRWRIRAGVRHRHRMLQKEFPPQ